MRARLLAMLPCLILVVGLWAPWAAAAEEPVVLFFVFEAQDCEHCRVVREEVLAPLQEEYGRQVEIQTFDIGAMENYEVMVRLEKKYGVSGLAIPQIFIGDTVLVGEEEIRERLVDLVDQYLEAGGRDYPTDDEPVVAAAVPSGTAAAPFCEDPG